MQKFTQRNNLTHWTMNPSQKNVLKMSTWQETATPLTDGCNNNRWIEWSSFLHHCLSSARLVTRVWYIWCTRSCSTGLHIVIYHSNPVSAAPWGSVTWYSAFFIALMQSCLGLVRIFIFLWLAAWYSGELSLSCVQPTANGWLGLLMCVGRPL